MKQSIETERKFLIAMPAWEDVEKNASVIYDITQIYLKSPLGLTHRIRSLKSGNCEKYLIFAPLILKLKVYIPC